MRGTSEFDLGGSKNQEVPHDERKFFESFYRASVRGAPSDRMTIGPISDPEARFHYNAVENAIIRALARRSPPPKAAMVEAWRALQQRQKLRVLDIGSGTGHWVDFFLEVYFAGSVTAVEITGQMADFLKTKYAQDPRVGVLHADIADPSFDAASLGAPMDYVSAIGVMFHIVDDQRWERAMRVLRDATRPDGLLLIGGDFGAHTRNLEGHKSDEFSNWREFKQAPGTTGEVRISRRVRSLSRWSELCAQLGLAIEDLVRSDSEPGLVTPENDLLLLRRLP